MRRSTVSGEDPQHLLQPPYRPREPLKHRHHGRAQLLPWNKLAVSTQGDCARNGVFGPTRRAEVRRDGHRE